MLELSIMSIEPSIETILEQRLEQMNQAVPVGIPVSIQSRRIVPVPELTFSDAKPKEASEYVNTKHPWMNNAACRGLDPSIFIPDSTLSKKEKNRLSAVAQRTCRSCVVVDKCEEHALDYRENSGTWGGLSERQRRSKLKTRSAKQ